MKTNLFQRREHRDTEVAGKGNLVRSLRVLCVSASSALRALGLFIPRSLCQVQWSH